MVVLWLWGIIVNLLTTGGYFDVALRDFGLSMGALSLARLAHANQLERRGQLETAPVVAEAERELVGSRR